jgi:hypothetical protein
MITLMAEEAFFKKISRSAAKWIFEKYFCSQRRTILKSITPKKTQKA